MMGTLRLLLVAMLSLETRVSGKYFGSSNGYDQEGGNEPICWRRKPNSSFSVQDYSIDFLRGLQDDLKATPAELLDDCFEGLFMNVSLATTDTGTENEKILVAGSHATFRIEMMVDTSSLGGLKLAPANQFAWRVKFCDAGRTGFCTPFQRGRQLSENVSTVDNVADTTVDNEMLPTLGVNVTDRSEEPADKLSNSMWFVGPLELSTFSSKENSTDGDGNSVLFFVSSVTFAIPEDVLGTYYGIGHAVLLLGSNETTASVQVDVANALPRRVFSVVLPPIVMKPTRAYMIGISVLLSIVALFQLTLLAHIIIYRKNMVMKFSQPPFLSLLVVCCLTASVSCILFIPEDDLHCNLWSPLILIPVSTIASILIARMWRMYVILSSSLRLSVIAPKKRPFEERFMSALTFLASWHEPVWDKLKNMCRAPPPPSRRRPSLYVAQHQLRKEVSDLHVLQLIISLSLPQIMVEVIALNLNPSRLGTTMYDGISRVVCESVHWWPDVISLLIVVLLFLMAVLVAWICRDLPSLFNEKKQVFRAACINFVVMMFAAAMVILTDFGTSSPNVRAFLWTAVTLCSTLTPCFYLILPKVMRARKGETVVMSRLFHPSTSFPRNSLTATPVRADDSSDSKPLEQYAVEEYDVKKKVVIREFEPPPRQLEYQLLAMKDLLTQINNSSTEGRRITKQEWVLLQDSSNALNNHLQRLRFDFQESDGELDSQRENHVKSVAEVFSLIDESL